MAVAALAVLAMLVLWGVGAGHWLLFALLFWGGGAMLMRPHQRHRPVAAAGPDRRTIRRTLPEISQMTYGRLPVEYQTKVDRIRAKVEWLLRYADRYPIGSQELYVIQRTATDYLPNTLRTYLALPPGSAYQPVTPGGPIALHVLWDQLDLLDRKMDEMAHNLQRRNLDDLLANGRFLEERFGGQSSELSRPEGNADGSDGR